MWRLGWLHILVSIPPCCYSSGMLKTPVILPNVQVTLKHTQTPLAQQSGLTLLSRHCVETHKESEFSHNSSGNTWPQSSQLAELLWTHPGWNSGLHVHQLISTKKLKSNNNKLCRHRLIHNNNNKSYKCLNLRKKSSGPPQHENNSIGCLLPKGRHGIFNMHNNLSVCCAHEGKPDTLDSCTMSARLWLVHRISARLQSVQMAPCNDHVTIKLFIYFCCMSLLFQRFVSFFFFLFFFFSFFFSKTSV